jgi:bleomycin hydrolase
VDTRFSDMVKTKGRTNQLSSGRCWLFTGLNVMRAKMIEKFDMGPVILSQNYVFFYDQLEKANLFLQGIIDTKDLPDDDRTIDWLFAHPIGDGGQFTGVSNLIMKYGVVPAEVFPESMNANNTSQMRAQITNKLREDGIRLRQAAKKSRSGIQQDMMMRNRDAELQIMKVEQLKEIYHMLALCLGVPPTEFTWTRTNSKGEVVNTKQYTPKSFYDEYIGTDLENNYIMVMNDPCHEYYKIYEIDYDRHVYDGENWVYLNLPVDEIKKMAIASIKDNTALYFSCDVSKFLIRDKGFADLNNFDYESLMGVTFGMDKKERIYTHASASTHAMTLIAVDLKDGKPVKWMVENSWGATSGYQGNIIMTDEWFDEYMFRLVVDKKYVPESLMKYFKQKPILLPAWDPMFLPEE